MNRNKYVALTFVVLSLPIFYFVFASLASQPNPITESNVLADLDDAPDAIARTKDRPHPGQGRGPKTLPPPFAPDNNENGTGEIDITTTTSLPGTTTTSVAEATTTSRANTTTTTASGGQSDGVITGRACPCRVVGTVELKGAIDLAGDIMVDGGTLVARPGVDLDGNGHQIMFMNGGRADFQGTPTSTWSGDGSNANLTRDVNFKNLSRIMFHQGAGKSTMRFFRLTDAGVSEKLGFYPIHFHKNGNSVRGTLVEGVVVDNAANHAFVPHGSHGITFKDTIAKNVIREAYWWDPGAENASNDIVYDHALADGVDYPQSFENPGLHHRVSAFLLGRGSGNVVKNSMARGTRGGSDCSGFHWPEHDHAVWTFTNNSTTSSECRGIFVWQNDDLPHVINGFSGGVISHGAYLNRYTYRNLNVAGVEVKAQGVNGHPVVFDGGSLGNVTTKDHTLPASAPVTFRNAHIASFTIDNMDSGEVHPGWYVLENTNLSCGDIVYKSVVPGTKVVIDGTEC